MLPSSAALRLLGRRLRVLLEQRHGRHHEARRAEAAHQAVVVAEGLLHRDAAPCPAVEALDRADRPCPASRWPASSTRRSVRPSTITVQAPHVPRSQTRFEPGDVEPRRASRRAASRAARPLSLCVLPSMVSSMRHLARADRRGSGLRLRSARSEHPGRDEVPPTVFRNERRLTREPGLLVRQVSLLSLSPSKAMGPPWKRERLFQRATIISTSLVESAQ